MPRPPFDPSRAKGSSFEGGLFDPKPVAPPAPVAAGASPSDERAAAPTAPSEMSVTDVSSLIERTLADGIRGPLRVRGEIANLSRKNHWYFSIKDAASVLRCVMWQSDSVRVGFSPKEGDAVVVTGKIGHYGPQGSTQLYVSKMEPQGVGLLEQRFQALVKELREKGYFEESRKKALPAHPRRVAVVTSASGAALHDVTKTARELRAGVEFVVVDVRVQGDGAAEEVSRALRAIARRHRELAIDAVIVTRGGGSREDRWAFNERVVAEAAFALPVPLVAAIGHEVDTSVIELVADRRASTPTQAAMLLLPDNAALAERCDRLAKDLRHMMRWSLELKRGRVRELEAAPALASPALRLARERNAVAALGARLREAASAEGTVRRRRLDAIASRLARQSPVARVAAAVARLEAMRPRLSRAMAQRLSAARTETVNLERRLRSAGPEETLARGYAIVTDESGALVRSVSATGARAGAPLSVQVADGAIPVRVEMRVEMRVEKDARDSGAEIGAET